jgi:arylsulfatase A-like enzyme
LPTFLGQREQKTHDFFYFEFHELNGRQAVIQENWKLLHLNLQKEPVYELYNIASDPSEVHNVISLYPEKAEELKKLCRMPIRQIPIGRYLKIMNISVDFIPICEYDRCAEK